MAQAALSGAPGAAVGGKPGHAQGRCARREASPALAAWVTHRDELEPLQATGGWLP